MVNAHSSKRTSYALFFALLNMLRDNDAVLTSVVRYTPKSSTRFQRTYSTDFLSIVRLNHSKLFFTGKSNITLNRCTDTPLQHFESNGISKFKGDY